ncbi:hypothetical protein LUZ60_000174 [Juncus effusus]|nr:hypothetical protein LUZ60_000174 [Juncus effusus]
MEIRRKPISVLLLIFLFLVSSSAASFSAAQPSKLVSNFVSNAASSLIKRLWSLKSTTKSTISGRQMVRFESGYTVETVFDGSKLGIEPYSVEITQSGDLLLLDSVNSNIYRLSLPLSRYSRPKLIAGSAEGYSGHIDGKLRDAKLNHPKGITMDDRGNIYVADAMNMAVRKISDSGVTTIAGGKPIRGGHVDGPSDEAKLSTDFEVRYLESSCSLLVIDRGNQAIREIQLNLDDCAYHYETGFPLGVALLFAAGFFGYMLALLQRRVGGMVSNYDEPQTPPPSTKSIPPYQKPFAKPSVRPPLIPSEFETLIPQEDETDETFFTSVFKLLSGARSSFSEILSSIFNKKQKSQNPLNNNVNINNNVVNPYQYQYQPVQETFSIPHDESPPLIENRTPTPKKNYAFMSKEPEKIHHLRHSHSIPRQMPHQQPQSYPPQRIEHTQSFPAQRIEQSYYHNRQYSVGPQTVYERSCESTNEIVFGAVQEESGERRTVEIKAVNYGDDFYERYGVRYRNSNNSNGFVGFSGGNNY